MSRIAIATLTFAALAAGSAAQAQTVYPAAPGVNPGMNGGMNSGNITAHKQKELAKIQQKMGILQQLQSCVSAAATTDAIHQCNETAHSEAGQHQKKC